MTYCEMIIVFVPSFRMLST